MGHNGFGFPVGRKARRRGTGNPSGQATVEFALIVPIVVLLLVAVVDFGRLVAVQAAVITASREAARYGATTGPAPAPAPSGTLRYRDCAGIDSAARQVVGPLVDFPTVTVQYDAGPSASPHGTCGTSPEPSVANLNRVVVTVNATYQPISPMIQFFIPNLTVQSIDRRTIGLPPPSAGPSPSVAPSVSPSASP